MYNKKHVIKSTSSCGTVPLEGGDRRHLEGSSIDLRRKNKSLYHRAFNAWTFCMTFVQQATKFCELFHNCFLISQIYLLNQEKKSQNFLNFLLKRLHKQFPFYFQVCFEGSPPAEERQGVMTGELPQFYMFPCSYGITNFYEETKNFFKQLFMFILTYQLVL